MVVPILGIIVFALLLLGALILGLGSNNNKVPLSGLSKEGAHYLHL